MSANLTVAEARALGLLGKDGNAPTRKKRTTNKHAPSRECGTTSCHACGETFPRQVDENRHARANPTHRRYECELTRADTNP